MTSTRLAGHALPHEGRLSAPGIPFWSPQRPRTGKATCTCGATSDSPLPSDNARRQWHRDHKDAVRHAQTTEGETR